MVDIMPEARKPLINKTEITVLDAKEWAQERGAHELFVHTIIPALFEAVENQRRQNGEAIDAAVIVAQSAKETGWGHFGGVLTSEWRNTAGIKTRYGGANADPEAHQRFDSWEDGARGHLNHLGAYVGLDPVGEPHGRWYTLQTLSWIGTVKYVEELGGRWAPNVNYGLDVVRMSNDIEIVDRFSEVEELIYAIQLAMSQSKRYYGPIDGKWNDEMQTALVEAFTPHEDEEYLKPGDVVVIERADNA